MICLTIDIQNRDVTADVFTGLAGIDRYGPAIDAAWFPNTPRGWFWSSSPNT